MKHFVVQGDLENCSCMYFKVEAFHITDIFHCCNWVVAMRTGQKYLQTTVGIQSGIVICDCIARWTDICDKVVMAWLNNRSIGVLSCNHNSRRNRVEKSLGE